MRVAVMQPYFAPYAGYFRLFQACDVLVVFDTAQFLRRGWMHRNRVPNHHGEPTWLTLPLRKAPHATRVSDMRFAKDAGSRWTQTKLKWSHHDRLAQHPSLEQLVDNVSGAFADYAILLLSFFMTALDLDCPRIVRATELGVEGPGTGDAQDRVIALVRALGGDLYVNPPGGRAIYDRERFERAGLEIAFLSEFVGAHPWSILHRYLSEPPADVREEICDQCSLQPA